MAIKPDKPVMVGARISPKLQYGLRLLARVQGRTIADAVEWSINLALRQTRIGGALTEERLNKLVDRLWDAPSEAQRIYLLNTVAPELLDFEERATWNLVVRCEDLWEQAFFAWEVDEDDENRLATVRVSADDEGRDSSLDESKPLFPLIEEHWDALRFVGTSLGKAGEIEMRFTLQEILDGTAVKRAGVD